MIRKPRLLAVCLLMLASLFISADTFAQNYKRIVSLNGTITEIICALGFEKNLVGVDVTSTYPASVKKLSNVGHNRTITAEPVLALQPDLIVSTANFLSSAVIEQFKSVNVKTAILQQDYSLAGTKQLITNIAATLGVPEKGTALNKQLDQQQAALKISTQGKKVLFIYARGAGTMMVAGSETPVDKIIGLAGGINAASSFKDFKPFTAEALVAANPDVILMFDSGLESMGGIDGLLKVQGVSQTNAGKKRKVVAMDGQLLTGFGPRVVTAIRELSQKINA